MLVHYAGHYAGSLLVHRLRRRTNILPAQVQHPMFAG